eukprot:346090-Chlamydomonas_euryale.AAC.15
MLVSGAARLCNQDPTLQAGFLLHTELSLAKQAVQLGQRLLKRAHQSAPESRAAALLRAFSARFCAYTSGSKVPVLPILPAVVVGRAWSRALLSVPKGASVPWSGWVTAGVTQTGVGCVGGEGLEEASQQMPWLGWVNGEKRKQEGGGGCVWVGCEAACQQQVLSEQVNFSLQEVGVVHPATMLLGVNW